MNTQDTIISLLLSTKREGIEGTGNLLDYLVKGGFFTGPASGRMHGSYVGGLAEHSLAVYNRLQGLAETIDFSKKTNWGQMAFKIEPVNLIIAPLLHDVCKIGAYVRTKADDGWTNNRKKDKGHTLLSVVRIEQYIALTKLERLMIKYHMGIYGATEFGYATEYPVGNLDDILPDILGDPEYPLTSGEVENPRDMTKAQKVASQKRRYGMSLRNAWYHNPIVKFMYFADELATAEDRAKS